MDYNQKVDLFLAWCKQGYDGATAKVGFLLTSGKLVITDNIACHAGLYHSGSWRFVDNTKFQEMKRVEKYCFKQDPIVAIYTYVVNTKSPTERLVQFADWLTNKSPWADCFISKDGEWIAKNRVWVMDASQPSNKVAGAAMATRHPTEWVNRFQCWCALVDAGVNESKAYFLSMGLASYGDWKDPLPIKVVDGSEGHIPIGIPFSKESYNNFVAGKGREDRPYHEDLRYDSVNATWTGGKRGDLSFRQFYGIKPRGEARVVREINHNIFYKPKRPEGGVGGKYSFTDSIQLANLVEDMEEIINAS
jgi:hypothetical protein